MGATQQTDVRGGRGARARILDAANRLFYRDGIHATGVERLASEAAVSKRTLYQHFPSKAAVVAEYLRGMQDRMVAPISRTPGGAALTPRAQLLAIFSRSLPPGQVRGCPFHNAAVEAADAMPDVADIVKRHKQGCTDALIELARQAGAANPRLLGQQLAVLHEGAAALGTSLDDPAPWVHARKAAQVLIDHAVAS